MPTNHDSNIEMADVLIVDDESANLQLLSELLTRAGYQVRPTDDPQLAIDSSLEQPPKLILLDVRMPDMDGFEVCSRLKQDERTRDIPVLFISALQDLRDRIQGFEVGGVDFITKPFQDSEVLARVQTHMDLRNMQLNMEEIIDKRTAELSESESRYRGLVDNSIVGVFNTNIKGEFVFVNDAMVQMFDFDSPEHMLAARALSLWADSEQRDNMLEFLNKHGSTTNFETEAITNTGRHIYVLFSAKLLGENIVGMLMDITQRKKMELQLQESLVEIERLNDQHQKESFYLREEINLEHNYKNIIGNSDVLQYVLFKVEQIAETDTNVLVLGETGTGKELITRAIHSTSQRKNRPLIKLNCAALPANLIESELFGHERGSFTGAIARQTGRFEVANGSTLFLDEIGELPMDLQAKLLRVLEDGEFERLGSTKTIKVDVRIVAATNRDLEKDVSEGRFRQDLWYRLNVFPITIPPLRNRVEDIPLIVQYYLDILNRKLNKDIVSIPVKVMKALQNYPWPGNVRELANVLERAVITTSGSSLSLSEELRQNNQGLSGSFKSLYDMERDYIVKALEKTNWKVSGKNSAAEILGLHRGKLRAKMEKMDIQKS